MEHRQAYADRDAMLEMTETHGWASLARWVTEQAQLDRDYIERGATGWDEYQRAVGRLSAFRDVLARPGDLVELANQIERGIASE